MQNVNWVRVVLLVIPTCIGSYHASIWIPRVGLNIFDLIEFEEGILDSLSAWLIYLGVPFLIGNTLNVIFPGERKRLHGLVIGGLGSVFIFLLIIAVYLFLRFLHV